MDISASVVEFDRSQRNGPRLSFPLSPKAADSVGLWRRMPGVHTPMPTDVLGVDEDGPFFDADGGYENVTLRAIPGATVVALEV